MRNSLRLTAALLALAVAAVVAASARGEIGLSFGKGFRANMSGAVEVPAGDPDATGFAIVRLNPAEGLVCFHIHVENVDFPTAAAHIHTGAAGVAGPVLITLVAPSQNGSSSTGDAKGCVSFDPAVIRAIMANPAGYYVNVHNKQYPAGILRGQLVPIKESAPKPKVVIKKVKVKVPCKKPKR
jgi:hypothetical protein